MNTKFALDIIDVENLNLFYKQNENEFFLFRKNISLPCFLNTKMNPRNEFVNVSIQIVNQHGGLNST